jgi:mRNA interferase HigB
VISFRTIRQFMDRFASASEPLKSWFHATAKADWRNFADVKQTFGRTDQTKVDSGNTVTIFDIGGNKYRLIAKISDPKGKVYILRILTHKEYDTDQWKRQL